MLTREQKVQEAEEVINPYTTYSMVWLGDSSNLDGSRDFVLRLSGMELLRLIKLVSDKT